MHAGMHTRSIWLPGQCYLHCMDGCAGQGETKVLRNVAFLVWVCQTVGLVKGDTKKELIGNVVIMEQVPDRGEAERTVSRDIYGHTVLVKVRYA